VIVSLTRIMLSNHALIGMLLAVAVIQAFLAVFGQGHAGKYCVANPRDTDGAAGIIDEDSSHWRHVENDHINTGAGSFND
jgi:hypothetical protein